MADEMWDEIIPSGPDYNRARDWLLKENIKSRIDDAIQASLTANGEVDLKKLKDNLTWTSSSGTKIDASFIFNMADDDTISAAAVKDWLSTNDLVYDKKTDELKQRDVSSRDSVDIKRPGEVEHESIKLSDSEEVLAAIREVAGLKAKLAGKRNWKRWVKDDADAQKRIIGEAKALQSVYTRRNVNILKKLGEKVTDKTEFDETTIRHQEALVKFGVRELNAAGDKFWDPKRVWYDENGRKHHGDFVDWKSAVADGRISTGLMEKYGIPRASMDQYFTFNERGRVTGFTREGRKIIDAFK